MKSLSVIVADADMDKLIRLVRALKHSLFRDQQQLELLDQALETAEIRPAARVPRDVIRMNSCVRLLDFDTRQKGLYTLVFPEEANISRGFISGLAPLGISLLGRRKGDVIEARVPGGLRRLRVEQVWCKPAIAREQVRPGGSNRRELHPGHTIQRTALAI